MCKSQKQILNSSETQTKIFYPSYYNWTAKGLNNFWNRILSFLTCSWRFLRSNIWEQIELKLEKNVGIYKLSRKDRKGIFLNGCNKLCLRVYLIFPSGFQNNWVPNQRVLQNVQKLKHHSETFQYRTGWLKILVNILCFQAEMPL